MTLKGRWRVSAPLLTVLVGSLIVAIVLKIHEGTSIFPWTVIAFFIALIPWALGSYVLNRPRRVPPPQSGEIWRSGDTHQDLLTTETGLGLEILAFVVLIAAFDLRVGILLLAVVTAWLLVWVPDRLRRFQVVTPVEVKRPPGQVFDYVSDPKNGPLYIPSLTLPERVDVPLAVGRTYRERYQMAGHAPFEWEERVVAYEPGRRFAQEVIDDPHGGSATFEFIATPGGSTITFTYAARYTLLNAWMGQALRRSDLVRLLATRRREWMDNLKALLEEQG